MALLAVAVAGCGGLREEFYRGEIAYLHRAGERAYRSADYPAARRAFSRLGALVPDYAPAHAGLGNVALASGQGAVALRHYRRAVALDPGLQDALAPWQAYARSLPAPRAGEPTLVALEQALRSGEFAPLARDITDPRGWCAARRRARTPVVDRISAAMLAMERDGTLAGCPSCTRLAAWWFAPDAGPRHWPLVRRALDQLASGAEADALRYQLALAYERHRRRAEALTIYLSLLPDPRARERLDRLR